KHTTQHVVLACSAGVDSMVLINIALKLMKDSLIQSLRVVHLNHSSRIESNEEAEFLCRFCKENNISFKGHVLTNKIHRNFEATARQKRYDFFKSELKDKETLWMAHHLNDSFEWSLM